MTPLFFLLVFIAIAIVLVVSLPLKSTPPAPLPPPLLFDAISNLGLNSKVLTLNASHFGRPLQLPRILPLQLANITGRRPHNVTVVLPRLQSRATLTFSEPLGQVDKSALVKLSAQERFRIRGIVYDTVYMWRIPGEGDVILHYEKTKYGESVWECSCTGTNLRTSTAWPQVLKNIGSALKDCAGFAAFAFADTPPGLTDGGGVKPVANGLSDGFSCINDIFGGLWCDLFGCPSQNTKPPLTNADIIKDVRYVFQQNAIALATADLAIGWDHYNNGHGGSGDPTIGVTGYNRLLESGNFGTSIGASPLLEYGVTKSVPGTGNIVGDPNLVLNSITASNTNWDSALVRSYIAGNIGSPSDCGAASELCRLLTSLDNIWVQLTTGIVAAGTVPDPNNTSTLPPVEFYAAQWPFFLSVLEQQIFTGQEISFRTGATVGGKYGTPWNVMTGGANWITSLLLAELPLLYRLYDIQKGVYIGNFQWDEQLSLPPSRNNEHYPQVNYCNAWLCLHTTGCMFGRQDPFSGLTYSTLLNKNYGTDSGNTGVLDVGYMSAVQGVPANWGSDWNGSFPGWTFAPNDQTSWQQVVPSPDGNQSFFCNSSPDYAAGSQTIVSYTQWYDNYNGDVYKTLQVLGLMGGVTCTTNSAMGLGLTGAWSCTTNSVPMLTYGANNGSGTLNVNDTSLLMCSDPFPIALTYSATLTGGTPSFSNGWPFDTSFLSETSFFQSLSSIACCPQGTLQAQGCWNQPASVSEGNETTPYMHSRQLQCVQPYALGNNMTIPAFIPAGQCVATGALSLPITAAATVMVLPPLSPDSVLIDGVFTDILATMSTYPLVFVENDQRAYYSQLVNNNQTLNPFYYFSPNTPYYQYSLDSQLINTMGGLPWSLQNPQGGTCTSVSNMPSYFTYTYDGTPKRYTYNFSVSASSFMDTKPVPTSITVSDGTHTLSIGNTGNPSFQVVDVSKNVITQFTNSQVAYIRVTEQITGQLGEAPRNTTTCEDPTSFLCQPCPVNSYFSGFNWAGYKSMQVNPPGVIVTTSIIQVPPAWNVNFIVS